MKKNTVMTVLPLKNGIQLLSHAIAQTISNMNGKIRVVTNALKASNTFTRMNAINAHRVTATIMKVFVMLVLQLKDTIIIKLAMNALVKLSTITANAMTALSLLHINILKMDYSAINAPKDNFFINQGATPAQKDSSTTTQLATNVKEV